eukprot:scaffold46385_cov50-Attheya_sp.AAC.2
MGSSGCLPARLAPLLWVVVCLALLPGKTVLGLTSRTNMPPLAKSSAHDLPLARQAMHFFDSSPDPFHAVQTSVDMLENAGFQELPEREPYADKLVPGGKYYFTKNKSTLVAFAVGSLYKPGNGGFKIIGGHTDSPNLKVKPRSKRGVNSGCTQLAVECYGGGLWHTWFDRDLGVSGRVLVRNTRYVSPSIGYTYIHVSHDVSTGMAFFVKLVAIRLQQLPAISNTAMFGAS